MLIGGSFLIDFAESLTRGCLTVENFFVTFPQLVKVHEKLHEDLVSDTLGKFGGNTVLFDLANRTKPILKWAGGKSALLPQLVEHFPRQFSCYLEPFLGGGAVFFSLRKNHLLHKWVNDSDPDLYNLYCVVRDTPQSLMRTLAEYSENYSESFYYKLREQQFEDPVLRASQTVFLNKCGFNGLYRKNRSGKFNVPFGKRAYCPILFQESNLLEASERLRSAELTCVDFETVLEQAPEGSLVYCDPPYAPVSATASFRHYQGSGFSLEDQQRLWQACLHAHSRGVHVVVSNSYCDSIVNLYGKDRVRTVNARRNINSKGSARGPVQEVLGVLLAGGST